MLCDQRFQFLLLLHQPETGLGDLGLQLSEGPLRGEDAQDGMIQEVRVLGKEMHANSRAGGIFRAFPTLDYRNYLIREDCLLALEA